MKRHLLSWSAAVVGLLVLTACSGADSAPPSSVSTSAGVTADNPAGQNGSMAGMSMSAGQPLASSAPVSSSVVPPSVVPPPTPAPAAVDVLPGMPPVTDPHNIYSDA